ncbi:MAG: HAD-IA family hydrolase [Propionicimonas sp.]|nr:HAD-IA family hydrolase [Propionicimonas sp.]
MSIQVKALVLDADGVVQHPSLGWLLGWARMGGPAFIKEISRKEDLTLTGEQDLEPLITELLAERGLDLTFDEVIAHWCSIDLDDRMLELSDRVRASGVRIAMGTNQNPYRGRFMLDNLPYDEHFDALFHSWQIGYAKPDPAFFTHIVDALGIEPQEAVFVDDMAPNVAGARRAGLQAVHFSRLDTYGELRAKLRTLGVPGI